MLSDVIFWAAIALIVSGAFFGLVRGFARSFLRFFTVLCAFISSALLCTSFIGDPDRLLNLPFVAKLIERVPLLRDLTEALPDLAPLVLSLPTAMFSPLVFFLLFFVLSAVLLVVYGIVAAFALPKNGKRKIFAPVTHVLGMVIGAAQGVIVTLALLVPIIGTADLAVEIIDTVEAEGGEYRVEAVEKLSPYRDELVAVQESQVYLYAERFGGGAICESLMRYEIKDGDGNKTEVALREETLTFAKMYAHSFPLQKTKPAAFGDRQAAALRLLADDLTSSELLSRVMAGFLGGASTEWKDGNAFLGIKPFVMEGELASLPSVLYDAFDESTPKTVREDLVTLSDLVGLLAEHGLLEVMSDGEALLERATDSGAITEIVACLRSNPRTSMVADELLAIAFRTFRNEFLASLPTTDPNFGAYRDMLGAVASAVNGLSPDATLSEQLEELTPALESALSDYGIHADELSVPLLETAAETVLDGVGDRFGSITADDIAALISGQGAPSIGE